MQRKTDSTTSYGNLNTVLMFIVLGTLGFLGVKATSNNEQLVKFEERGRAVQSALERLDHSLSDLVSRREFDGAAAKSATDFQAIQTEIARINVRLRELDLAYLELKGDLIKLHAQPGGEGRKN